MDRRKFITAIGASTAVAVAGCSDGGSSNGGGGGGNDADTSSPTAIVESFYEASDEVDEDASTDEILDAVDPYLHSASPFPDVIRESEDSDDSQTRSLESISTEIIEENVDESALNNQYGLSFFDVSEDDVAAVAEENAIVEGQLSYDNGDDQQVQHITATEGGDWLLVL
ncbi:MAG: hypothetical protein ACI8TL_000733 [Natronomonas sp.]|jgi:hypothetical protein